MPFCCYNLLKYYSLILGVPGAVIIPKLQSCIPIVMSGCCSLASSRSGGAHSSHSRPSKSKGPPSMQFWWLLSSPAPRSCAISASWCWRWSPRSSLPFASLTLFVLPLVVIVVLFLTVENHCCVFSFCVSLCATGVTVLSDRVGAAALLTLCLAWWRSFYWVEIPTGCLSQPKAGDRRDESCCLEQRRPGIGGGRGPARQSLLLLSGAAAHLLTCR